MSGRLRVKNSKFLELTILLAALIAIRLVLAPARASISGLSPEKIAVTTVQLFAIMDPIAALPFYIYFEENMDQRERVKLRTTVMVAMTVLLVFFAMVGSYLLELFGVSVYSLMIGGGVLLMVLAVDIMGEGSRSLSLDPEEAAIVPIASPLLVGPGTAVTLIILSETIPLASLLVSLAIIVAAIGLILRFSRGISALLGKNGIKALSRLFSIIIAGFAAQLIFQGLVGWGLIR